MKTRPLPHSIRRNRATAPLCLLTAFLTIALLGGCRKAEPPQEAPIRLLQTMVIGDTALGAARNFPGKVLAGKRVDLSFNVAGTIIDLPIRSGDPVEANQVLARLDPRDFENALAASEAELDRATVQFERVEEAAALNAVSQQDLSDARATMEVAKAETEIRRKSLEDSVLLARFSGVIADRFVDNFQTITPKEPIVRLQDSTEIDIEIYVPESYIISETPDRVRDRETRSEGEAIFDFLPGSAFPVDLKEFSTRADPITQAFRAVVTMPSPESNLILPGMTATVRLTPRVEYTETGGPVAVPLDAVPVDGASGKHFVWLVEPGQARGATVRKQFVEVGGLIGKAILITDGLKKGDRIALVGVTMLVEGQQVNLMDEEPTP
jgi:multidrug efflux system membrane fusion protein